MMGAMRVGEPEPRPATVAILDANPILGEAMLRHFTSSKYFGRKDKDVVTFTWDQIGELVSNRPSILVLDPNEAPNDLEELVTSLVAEIPDLQMIAYTSDPTPSLARTCISLGFRAFVPKSVASDQLTSALTAVANGGMYVDRHFAAALLPSSQSAEEQGVGQLSVREEAVLRRISLGLSHKQIATELELSQKTVDTYRARGMRKLGLADRGELVRFALAQRWLE